MATQYIHCPKANDTIHALPKLLTLKPSFSTHRLDLLKLQELLATCPNNTCYKSDVVDYLVNTTQTYTYDNWSELLPELLNYACSSKYIEYKHAPLNYAVSIPVAEIGKKEIEEWIFHIPNAVHKLVKEVSNCDYAHEDIRKWKAIDINTLAIILNTGRDTLYRELLMMKKIFNCPFLTPELFIAVFGLCVLPWIKQHALEDNPKIISLIVPEKKLRAKGRPVGRPKKPPPEKPRLHKYFA